VPGSGCFINTDYNAEELWLFSDDYVVSTSFIQVAATPFGPWRNFSAPWSPRAAAALTTHWNSSVAYFGSGMTFVSGDVDPLGPTFGDAWRIDTSVCLLGANAQVCSGNGVADLGSVTCRCAAGFSGIYCDQGSSANSAASSLASSPAATAGGIIGFVIAAIIGLIVYNRNFAGRIPPIDGIAARVDEGVSGIAQDLARRARSISGGGGGGGGGGSPFLPRAAAPASPTAKGSAGVGGSSPGAYGSL
jgi:hypothetical protein